MMQAGPVGFMVLIVLVLFSIASWAIIAHKFLLLHKAQKQSIGFLEIFWTSKRLDEVFDKTEPMHDSPVAQVFRAGYQELVKVKQREQKQQSEQVNLGGAENVERALRRASTSEMTNLERLIPFLATVGSTGPFIGLFGTVVGIINSFTDIGTHGSASLATVGPGIAEALVATAAGLLAAIPAVMAYNFFSSRLRVLAAEMENFSADFMNIVRRHFF
ncbi:MAG: protein TolQ [Deltaproteobacteria bacterium]|nr:protein TolQ [Deltaproteobacteria bacterium]